MARKSHDPEWLKARGYDGLYNGDFGTEACGCAVDDFAPCGEGPYPECVTAELRDDGLFYPAKRKRVLTQEPTP
jgi:hypothetical protein